MFPSIHLALASTLVAWLLTMPAAQAAASSVNVTDHDGKLLADVEISQAQRQFRPRVTPIPVGTRVTFPNFDTVRDHVFSPTKTFELKPCAGGPSAPLRIGAADTEHSTRLAVAPPL